MCTGDDECEGQSDSQFEVCHYEEDVVVSQERGQCDVDIEGQQF